MEEFVRAVRSGNCHNDVGEIILRHSKQHFFPHRVDSFELIERFTQGDERMKPQSLKSILAHGIAALAISLAGGSAVAADDFPNKPVRIIIPAAAGGSLDITTRLIAQKMTEKLGQQVIVENRPGAETLLGTRVAKDAPADGYTILGQANSFSLLPHIWLDPGYDPLKGLRRARDHDHCAVRHGSRGRPA